MISKKKKKESDLEIDFDDSLIEDSSEEICLPQIIKNFDEEQAVFRDSMSLLPALLPPHRRKLLFFVGFFHKFNFEHIYNLLVTSGNP